ncbi:hypothetical protein HaLaN_05097, partial [Haematococcus lacustris]
MFLRMGGRLAHSQLVGVRRVAMSAAIDAPVPASKVQPTVSGLVALDGSHAGSSGQPLSNSLDNSSVQPTVAATAQKGSSGK